MIPDAPPKIDPQGRLILRGWDLRYVLTALIVQRASVDVAELIAALHKRGLTAPDRLSKSVSDALKGEIRKGRVVRVGWGRYAAGTVPRSTLARIRSHAREVESRAG